MKVKELVAQLLELPQDDTIVVTSMNDDFMCHEFSVHSAYEENTQAQEIILPFYFNDYEEEPSNYIAEYTYYWNEETGLLTIYENGCVLSTVQGVQKNMVEEIFKEDVFNITGVEL